MYTLRIELADSDTTDAFETLSNYIEMDEAVTLLQGLGVDDEKLKGVVCSLALRQAGLE